MVRDDVNQNSGSLQVVSPSPKGFENREEFLVVGVVVEFRTGERPGVESHRVEFPGVRRNRENSGDSVVRGVRFDGDLPIRFPMAEYRCRRERLFEGVEGLAGFLGEVPWDGLPRKASERKYDLRVVVDKSPIEVRKSEESLDVPDFPGFRPVQDCLYLRIGHRKALSGEDVSEVFHGLRMEFALVGAREKLVLAESSEYLADMFSVVLGVVGVDENVVEVDHHADVEQVREDLVDKTLECRGRVGKSERHYQPLERSVAGPKGGFPLISGRDPDEIVGVPEIDLSVNAGFPRRVQEVRDQR